MFTLALFATPFLKNWVPIFLITAFIDILGTFVVVYFWKNGSVADSAIAWVIMTIFSSFLLSYFLRWIMTKAFLLQTQAEESRDSLNSIFDSLPEAVLVLEN